MGYHAAMDRWIKMSGTARRAAITVLAAAGLATASATSSLAAGPIVLTIGGTDGTGFTADCTLTGTDEPATRQLDGVAPARYEFQAEGLACAISKTTATGRLDVEARKGRGIVSRSALTGRYAMATVSVR